MKKLIIVTDAWAPQVNGVVTLFERTIPYLKERDFEVTVVHPGLFIAFPFPLYPEISMTFFPDRKMKKIFDSVQPDYVHIATEWTLGLSARSLLKGRGIAFTTSYHTNFPRYLPHYIFGGTLLAVFSRVYMSWFHSSAEAVMASNDTLKAELEAHNFKNVVLWPPGIDTTVFKPNEEKRAEVKFPHPVFVYFGRIAKEKSVEEFLSMELPGTKLVIGDGPERKKLERRYGKKNVFLGYKRGQELIDILSASDVFVFPSRTETFGLVVLEALACGLPVAAHNVMGPKDVIENGIDGFLSDDLTEAAKKCLTLSREKCREKALTFSWEHSADMFAGNVERYVGANAPVVNLRTQLKKLVSKVFN
ncbi:MAG: glycosyltransferase family 1 protein [Candidatus Pacebacteria bacterium]|nr:glycosyltransferase family 1 protein [Candidatus Paceibacterota bacterium]MBP9832081.1 glycosyltransferase family 1 protein [Candidatus Paceibacterota bacterium]